MEELTIGSLFDGIGGFPLAANLVGIKPIWSCEIEKIPKKITAERFPDMLQFGDIRKLKGAELPPVWIIAGGSPCQNLSISGKREGLKGKQSRLFMEQIRIVKEMRDADRMRGRADEYVRPRWMLWENVKGALIPLMINNASQDKPLPVYGAGLNVRDWLYVKDHCYGILAVLEKGRVGEIYNLGGHNEKANIDIVKIILHELGKPESLITYVTDRKGHDQRYAIDPSKANKELGWEPTTMFADGIKLTIQWYNEHMENNNTCCKVEIYKLRELEKRDIPTINQWRNT